ncbi:MAG TPA: pilus assembly protein PilM [Candidatus Elarobacter sp.]|jgi:Tfp pilus assembly PilM family ATPase|nr:pilus assembly protein PilM [Candidatus Elarobacter sp.]
MSRRTLPLGIDVGAVRTRVALLELDPQGRPALVAVAARACAAADAAAAIGDARDELRTRERRCVLALTVPDAVVRTVVFPSMSARERTRAARFEAARFVPYPAAESDVRVIPAGRAHCVVAVARRAALDARIGTARRAGLRPLAVDDAAFALMRAFPDAGAIVDVGEDATTLTVPGDTVPSVAIVAPGSGALSRAVAEALGIDRATADERKHAIGLAGAGDGAREALIDALASSLASHRAASASEIRSVVLTGNGARLAGFAVALERAIAIPVSVGAIATVAAPAYPPDVVRAASPDWALAYGLALWERAA